MPFQVLLLLAALLACHSQASAQSDAELLLAFKETFTNGAQLLDTWSDGTALCPSTGEYKSKWTSVTCQDDRVIKVELPHLGLDGAIPPTGWPLPDSLRVLGLGDNFISGTITNWKLPPNLEELLLNGNTVSGSIAAPFTDLPGSMKHLDIGSNDLTGVLPGDWILPERFEALYLRDTFVTGPIPKAWETQLPRAMTWLVLSFNGLTGTLPANWDFPPKLQGLVLGTNKLAGTLPQWPNLPSTIKQLDLSNNQLTGPLPKWSTLTNSSRAMLYGNPGLCGQVPQVDYQYVGLDEQTSCPSSPPPSASVQPPSQQPQSYLVVPSPQPSLQPTSQGAVSKPAVGSRSSGSSSSTGVIVGVAVGAVCLVALAGLAGWWWRRRRRQSLVAQGKQQHKEAMAWDATKPGEKLDLEQAAPKEAGPLTYDSTPIRVDHAKTAPGLLVGDLLISSIAFQLDNGSNRSSKSSSSGSSRACSDRSRTDLSTSQYTVAFRRINFIKQIGKGSFGIVYLGRWNEIDVAVKLLLGDAASISNPAAAADALLSDSNPAQKTLQEEAGILANLRHPNMLSFLGMCLKPPCVISEYCARGSLYDLLKEAKTSPELQRRLDWPRRLQMACDAAKGMLYLHTRPQPVAHRDLKSPNLLICKNWSIKVSDFNMSRIVDEGKTTVSTKAVTNPRWLAPEVIAGQRPTLASDVFSYGVIMWELLTWELPWVNVLNLWQVARFVMKGGRLAVPAADQVAGGTFAGIDEYIALMRHCWAQDPQQRPSFADIVAELRRLSLVTSKAARLAGQRSSSGVTEHDAELEDDAEPVGESLRDSAFEGSSTTLP